MKIKEAIEAISGSTITPANVPIRKAQLALITIINAAKRAAIYDEDFNSGKIAEVVRCKDCKHWTDGVTGCTDRVKCCKIGFYMIGENGYCVYGERKQNEQDKL